MGKAIVIICCFLTLISCKKDKPEVENKQVIKKVSVAEAKSLIAENDIQILDVRRPDELEQEGFIEGAVNVNFNSETFDTDLPKMVSKNKPVLVYCKAGTRSAAATQKMKTLGYVEIYDLEGGFSSWKNAK